jgi:hypothetical protein
VNLDEKEGELAKLIVAFSLAMLVCACAVDRPAKMILFDFEDDAELDRMYWQCFTLFSLSSEHAAHGEKSLKMEFFPSRWPGWEPKLNERDWRGFEALGFDLYNVQDINLSVTVRIDDRKGYPGHMNRYNQVFILRPGSNTIVIAFDSLVTSGSNRALDLGRIERLMLFMGSPASRSVLHLDHVRLIRDQGNLLRFG